MPPTLLKSVIYLGLIVILGGCATDRSQLQRAVDRINRSVTTKDVVAFEQQITPGTIDYLHKHVTNWHTKDALIFMMDLIRPFLGGPIKQVDRKGDEALVLVTNSKGEDAKVVFRKVKGSWKLDLTDDYASWIDLAKWASKVGERMKAATPLIGLDGPLNPLKDKSISPKDENKE